ncbi:MAG: NAD(+) synthase, partial [Clostridia bacterium]|nr:NAD(+) synthase [Clostridia bacterium]
QKTEDAVGPYSIHDFVLFHTLRNGFKPSKIFEIAVPAFEGTFTPDEILKWMKVFYRRFFSQQFKRSCLPDGVKIGSVTLSPRGDWRMPSDATAKIWLDDLERIEGGRRV